MDHEKELACRFVNDFIDMVPRFKYFKSNSDKMKILINSVNELKSKLNLFNEECSPSPRKNRRGVK